MGAWTSRPSSMFGGKISDHLDKDGVNKFVRWCVEEIERTGEGLRTDALYRASGGHDDVQRIKGQPERGMQALLNQEPNVHVLTGALKQFFRSLKQPILRIEEFEDVLECRENGNDASDKLVEIINNVPKLQRSTLAFFFKHLFRVMHELDNNMSLASLGVVFGPTLMRVASTARTEDVATMQARIEDLNLVVELLLQHYAKAFDDNTASRDRQPSCADQRASTQCQGAQTLPCPIVAFNDTRVVDAEGAIDKLPCSTDSTSNVEDTTGDLSSSFHEADDIGSREVDSNHHPECETADDRDNPSGLSRTSSCAGETPSLNDHTTPSSRSTSLAEEHIIESTGTTRKESTRRSSDALLDDLMNKSSDSEDIDSVLAHIAKALSPEHDYHKTGEGSDADRRSSSGTTSSCDVTVIDAQDCLSATIIERDSSTTLSDTREPEVTATNKEDSLSAPRITIIERDSSTSLSDTREPEVTAIDAEDSLSAPRITIIERDSSTSLSDTREPEVTATKEEANADPDMWSLEDKIRMFTEQGDNVSSLKKQKTLVNQESEEAKKVKTEFEETFEKVTQQKSN